MDGKAEKRKRRAAEKVDLQNACAKPGFLIFGPSSMAKTIGASPKASGSQVVMCGPIEVHILRDGW